MRALPLLLLCACADITAISDGATAGPVFVVKDWFTSISVLRYDDGVVLFDAGFRGSAVTRSLSNAGIQPGDVTDILITHGHTDHIGALSEFPGARVHAMAAESDLIEEEAGQAVTLQPLASGDTLTFGDHTVEVFGMPGHTPGSAAYFVGGALMLGDAALINGSGQLTPVAEDRSDDPAGAITALVNLADALEPREDEVTHLVPSHSGIARGFAPLGTFADQNRP